MSTYEHHPAIGSNIQIGFTPVIIDVITGVATTDGDLILAVTRDGHSCWAQRIPNRVPPFVLTSNHAHATQMQKLECEICNPLREGLELPPLKSKY